jgi:hypothetical protein
MVAEAKDPLEFFFLTALCFWAGLSLATAGSLGLATAIALAGAPGLAVALALAANAGEALSEATRAARINA